MRTRALQGSLCPSGSHPGHPSRATLGARSRSCLTCSCGPSSGLPEDELQRPSAHPGKPRDWAGVEGGPQVGTSGLVVEG